MKKWVLATAPKLVPVPTDPKHYNQLLAEIADLLLDSYCQLRQRDFKPDPIGIVPDTTAAHRDTVKPGGSQ